MRRRSPLSLKATKSSTSHQGPSVEICHDTDSQSLRHGAVNVVDMAGWRHRRGICWRCGVPFSQTDIETLRRCAELARAGTGTP